MQVRADALDEIARIPCATMLVRLVEAARSKDKLRSLSARDFSLEDAKAKGLIRPMPKYSGGAYDGSRCRPAAHEIELYRSRQSRLDVTVADRIRLMAPDQPFDPPGRDTPAKDVKMNRWVEKRLKRPPLTNDQPLSLVRFAPYRDTVGFRVCVDGAQNLANTDSYVFCITSLLPPGLYYRDQPLMEDVIVTREVDLGTTTTCPIW